MSRVFVAEERAFGRKVVVKVLPPELTAGLSVSRFKREIQLAAQLQHPHIVPVHSAGEMEGLPYYTMPFVDGLSLRERLERGDALPIAEIVRILKDVARALAYAHERGVVHRDIKPENLMWVEKTRKVMVADFGLAAVYHTVYDEEKAFILGSPLYVSPEQARGDAVDGRADLFSLGCVLLELTLGFLPVKVERPERIFQTRAKESPDMFTGMARDHSVSVPRAWSDFMAKALVPKRDQRFRDAEEMLAALRVIAPGLRVTDKETPVPRT